MYDRSLLGVWVIVSHIVILSIVVSSFIFVVDSDCRSVIKLQKIMYYSSRSYRSLSGISIMSLYQTQLYDCSSLSSLYQLSVQVQDTLWLLSILSETTLKTCVCVDTHNTYQILLFTVVYSYIAEIRTYNCRVIVFCFIELT